MNPWSSVRWVVVGVLAVSLLASCTASGGDEALRQSALPTVGEIEALDWGTSVDLVAGKYPAVGQQSLRFRSLPFAQVSYLARDESGTDITGVGVTLFEASSPRRARAFWRDKGPARVYGNSTGLAHLGKTERAAALRAGSHRARGQRSDEMWTVLCVGPTQSLGRNDQCDQLLVWVTWCSFVLEIKVGANLLQYREPRADAAWREIVDLVRERVRC